MLIALGFFFLFSIGTIHSDYVDFSSGYFYLEKKEKKGGKELWQRKRYIELYD